MYVKIFTSIFDGSMRGHADLILVFVNLICHADQDGVVDRHWQAIVDETGLSPARVKAAITALEGPDAESRSSNDNGRRIKRINPEREWGWEIVNYKKYDGIRSAADRREYMRNFMAEKRKNSQNINKNTDVSTLLAPVSNVSPSDSDSDSDKEEEEEEGSPTPAPVNNFSKIIQKLRIGHIAFKTVPDMVIKNVLKGWPQDRWQEAVESLIRHYAGANIPKPVKTLENYLAGKRQSKPVGLKNKNNDKKSFTQTRDEIIAKLDEAALAGGDAVSRCLSACNDIFRDAPRAANGENVVNEAYETWKFMKRSRNKPTPAREDNTVEVINEIRRGEKNE